MSSRTGAASARPAGKASDRDPAVPSFCTIGVPVATEWAAPACSPPCGPGAGARSGPSVSSARSDAPSVGAVPGAGADGGTSAVSRGWTASGRSGPRSPLPVGQPRFRAGRVVTWVACLRRNGRSCAERRARTVAVSRRRLALHRLALRRRRRRDGASADAAGLNFAADGGADPEAEGAPRRRLGSGTGRGRTTGHLTAGQVSLLLRGDKWFAVGRRSGVLPKAVVRVPSTPGRPRAAESGPPAIAVPRALQLQPGRWGTRAAHSVNSWPRPPVRIPKRPQVKMRRGRLEGCAVAG